MPLAVGHRENHHLHTVVLRLFDSLGQVVVPGHQIDEIGHPVATVGGQIEADAQVDPLLLAAGGQAPQAEFDPGELADHFLRAVGGAACLGSGVVPVHAQDRQATLALCLGDDAGDQVWVGDDHAASEGRTRDAGRRRGEQVADVDVDRAAVLLPARWDAPRFDAEPLDQGADPHAQLGQGLPSLAWRE